MPRTRRSPVPRVAAALGLGAVLALAAPLAASAHVTVSPQQAQPGSFTTLTVNAPTESDTASTVKLVVDLPTDHPLLTVRWVPVPGWTAVATTKKLPKPVKSGDDTITEAVTELTWTATAGGTPPGAVEQFPVSVGPIPDTTLLRLPAHQYYSDGTVVDWTASAEDAAHPAPRLYVDEAPPATAGSTTTTASATDATSTGPDVVARVIGLLGLVVGAVGIVVAVVALRRRPTS